MGLLVPSVSDFGCSWVSEPAWIHHCLHSFITCTDSALPALFYHLHIAWKLQSVSRLFIYYIMHEFSSLLLRTAFRNGHGPALTSFFCVRIHPKSMAKLHLLEKKTKIQVDSKAQKTGERCDSMSFKNPSINPECE